MPVPIYPALHVTVTLLVVVPVILSVVALLELATLPVGVHVLPMHVGKDINVPLVEQVVLPLPVNPGSHVTTTVWPVLPVILSVVALLELTTSVAVQELAVHVNVLN